MNSGFARSKLELSESYATATNPRMRRHLNTENTTPRSLFIHPRSTRLNIFSNNLPTSPRIRNTTIMIRAKAITFSTCSDAGMYWVRISHTKVVNLADAHTPASIDTIEIACEMNPFLSPCTMDGTRHIKIMISSMFIIPRKFVYLRIKNLGGGSACKIR